MVKARQTAVAAAMFLISFNVVSVSAQGEALETTRSLVVQATPNTLLLAEGDYLHPTDLPVEFGEGVAFDGSNNLFVALNGLRIYNSAFQLLGAVTVMDPTSTRTFGLALRNATQAFSCDGNATPARLFRFDITNLLDPHLSAIIQIPTAQPNVPCSALFFDEQDRLWLGTYHELHVLTLDTAGSVVSIQSFPMPVNPHKLAYSATTGRIAVASFNQNIVTLFDRATPNVPVITLTDVCDQPTWSPGGVAFTSGGDLFIGCANFDDSSNTDIVSIAAERLQLLAGNVSVQKIPNVKVALPTGGFGSETGFMAFQNKVKKPRK